MTTDTATIESTTTVFSSAEAGYASFRIPAIVRTGSGALLAFAEARRTSASDDGDIDLVQKRSTDGGRTWSSVQVVDENGTGKSGNPVPILDRRNGRIVVHLTRTAGHVSAADVLSGRADRQASRRVYVVHSDDDGLTWSPAQEITEQVKPVDWRHCVGGPGHGIQLQVGERAGRLVIAGNHSTALDGEPTELARPDEFEQRHYGAHAIYSDDGGASWQLGGLCDGDSVVNGNESSVTELPDGTLYFNTRDQHGSGPGTRAATLSHDGGETFATPYRTVPELIAPVVQGAVLSIGEKLIFSAPARPDRRALLQLRLSDDRGATWRAGPIVHDGPAGYSDLVDLDRQDQDQLRIGVLYEGGDPVPGATSRDRIEFATLSI